MFKLSNIVVKTTQKLHLQKRDFQKNAWYVQPMIFSAGLGLKTGQLFFKELVSRVFYIIAIYVYLPFTMVVG